MKLTSKMRQKALEAGVAKKHIEEWDGSPYIPKGKSTIFIEVDGGEVFTRRFKNPNKMADELFRYKERGRRLSTFCLVFLEQHGKSLSAQMGKRVDSRNKRKLNPKK